MQTASKIKIAMRKLTEIFSSEIKKSKIKRNTPEDFRYCRRTGKGLTQASRFRKFPFEFFS
ncbi:MAG TPA: hypothetical protein DER70_19885 [Lentisphaeria bacterium]|nr:hypothetical protein [Lentisphaeria bacterium]